MRCFTYLSVSLLFGFFLNGCAYRTDSAGRLSPTSAANSCPVSPNVADYPAEGPAVRGGYFANSDRTIWATFWGWDFVRRTITPTPELRGAVNGTKVLWVKPSGYKIVVTGRRIDGEAPPLEYSTADPGRLDKIQPSGLYFPTTGCWEVTAKAGSSELRFVVLIKAPNP
jgi:hypothetical protein